MTLIIQIPCYNEEETLPFTLNTLPRQVEGFDKVRWLVIDDGSTDNTVRVAEASGVDHVIRLTRHQGLAKCFIAGLDACVKLGADVIVNIDADNQYNANDIPRLVKPILTGDADIVVGSRTVDAIAHFSRTKKFLQKLGSWVVRIASNTDVPDAPSGFRAISRNAAMQLNVFDEYTYTLETIIQAGQKNMAITFVPIETNETFRPSRLMRSVPHYIGRSILTIIRIFMTYKPLRFFAIPGVVALGLGILISLRFLYFYFTSGGAGHIQSLILAALLMGTGFFLWVIGLIADLISVNRKLLEKLTWRIQNIEETLGNEKDD